MGRGLDFHKMLYVILFHVCLAVSNINKIDIFFAISVCQGLILPFWFPDDKSKMIE